jgi:hypothetical protein
MSNNLRNSITLKRKCLKDITNTNETDKCVYKTDYPDVSLEAMPIPRDMELEVNDTDFVRQYQNIHPMLGWYKPDLETGKLSYDQFRALLQPLEAED